MNTEIMQTFILGTVGPVAPGPKPSWASQILAKIEGIKFQE